MIDVPVEVKDALREGRLKKNYRVVVLNDDGTEDFTIDNDTLVSESVNIDERMCSGDTIKFGLCEGSSLEFQYFNHPNITDRQVQVFCDVEYGANQPYTIPMGFFTVKKCSRQASTGIQKVTAYNKLMSDYLDAKANILLENLKPDYYDGNISLYTILAGTLEDYGIIEKPKVSAEVNVYGGSSLVGYSDSSITFTMVNYSGTRSARIYSNAMATVNNNQPFERGTMIEIGDISNYIALLEDAINAWHYDVNRYVNNPDTLWNNLKDWYGASSYGITITYYTSDISYPTTTIYYTLPEMISGNNDKYRSIYTLNNIRLKDVRTMSIRLPNLFEGYKSDTDIKTVWEDYSIVIPEDLFDGKVYVIDESEFSPAEKITVNVSDLPDVTLRELQSASFDTVAQFGQLDRVTDLFSGVELNHSRLLPADSLYPDNALYPDGAQESAFRSQYSKLWADEGNIHKWRYLIITYKGLDGEGNEADFTLQRTINNDGTDDYNCSDNWLFRNLVWTEAQIGTYADAMKAKMQDITWFPFEMWCAGLPYLETGDEIEIPLGNQTYTSYILQRQLKGIQNLQDTYINGTLDIF